MRVSEVHHFTSFIKCETQSIHYYIIGMNNVYTSAIFFKKIQYTQYFFPGAWRPASSLKKDRTNARRRFWRWQRSRSFSEEDFPRKLKGKCFSSLKKLDLEFEEVLVGTYFNMMYFILFV